MTDISAQQTIITLKQFRKFSRSCMTRATSTRENTRANTAPPVKASGQKASLLTANVPNADERLQGKGGGILL